MSEAGEKIIVKVLTDKSKYRLSEPVRMTLKILNGGVLPVKLIFTSTQRYDFTILKGDEEVWRWSKDKVFAMVVGSVSLKPFETRTYTETWNAIGASPGEYKVVGVVTSRPTRKATCTFEIKN